MTSAQLERLYSMASVALQMYVNTLYALLILVNVCGQNKSNAGKSDCLNIASYCIVSNYRSLVPDQCSKTYSPCSTITPTTVSSKIY